MKKSLILVLLFAFSNTKPGAKLALLGAGVGASSLYFLYRYFRTPGDFHPTIENRNTVTLRAHESMHLEPQELHTLVKKIKKNKLPEQSLTYINQTPYLVHKGVALQPEDDIVFLFVRGYAKKDGPSITIKKQMYDLHKTGGGLQGAFIQCHDGIVPHSYPIIGFDLPDDQKNFAFGGPKEIQSLQCIYDEICNQHNSAHIVLIGDCRGGKVALDWLTTQPKRIKAVIVMAPFMSGKELSDTLAENHLSSWPPFSYFDKQWSRTFLYEWFFKNYYPSYNAQYDTLYDRLASINPSIPILITYRKKDALVKEEVIEKISDILQKDHSLSLAYTHDTQAPHSKMTNLPEIKKAVHQFYKDHTIIKAMELI